jgi:Ca2+-binding RTX toxin-like protein
MPLVPVESTFEADLEGWTLDCPVSNYCSFPDPPCGNGDDCILTWTHAPADQSEGYVYLGADQVGFPPLRAPSRYLGDWSALDGTGWISFDFNLIKQGGQNCYYAVDIYGRHAPGMEESTHAHWELRIPSDGTIVNRWLPIVVTLDKASGRWSFVPSSDEWEYLLADVMTFTVNIDPCQNGGTRAAIDNIALDGPFCHGRKANITGTPGNDTITPAWWIREAVVNGFGGNDTIYGTGGNDVICGGDGDDVIYAGDGNDAIFGGPGDDVLFGEKENDALHGEAGNDTLYGGEGWSWLVGGEGNDTLCAGGPGVLVGGPGDDVCGCSSNAFCIRSQCEKSELCRGR